jgi:hypothetical protein
MTQLTSSRTRKPKINLMLIELSIRITGVALLRTGDVSISGDGLVARHTD